jgi:hypothetical protein
MSRVDGFLIPRILSHMRKAISHNCEMALV